MSNTQHWDDWELKTEAGRQVWNYKPSVLFNPNNFWQSEEGKALLHQISDSFIYNSENANTADRVYRHLAKDKAKKQAQPAARKFEDAHKQQVYEAAYKAINYYQTLQSEDGHMPGDYGGPMFLLPGLVIASYVTDSPLPEPHTTLLKRYMLNHQNADGGWGLHLEGNSTMFGTVLQYVSLRILGIGANDGAVSKARAWILKHGGATTIPSWGKFYLSVMGVYEWQGCNSLFPEMWVLPKVLPFHPSRYWCHARMVYLPMSYCYGHKVTMKPTALTEELKQELYSTSYQNINWREARNQCCEADLYATPAPLLKYLNILTNTYEQIQIPALRKKALNFILDYINAEDEQTEYINIGPVNQVINAICVWHAYGKESAQFKKHYERWFDYLWLAEDGIKMQGYNGSQLWDAAFAAQAVLEGGFQQEFPKFTDGLMRFIDDNQVRIEVRDHSKFFRHDSVGGWPFSNKAHGWPITDCSAEGSKTMWLHMQESKLPFPKDVKRFMQNADLLLSFQNDDGGWASYENTRAPKWVEALNPSEIFGNIMIDYSYTECSSASMQSLAEFAKHVPDYKSAEIEQALKSGNQFLKREQRSDGSWYGSWAVCFTYGTWFGVEGLLASGDKAFDAAGKNASPAIAKACEFLLSKQNMDGGWGESFESCLKKQYIQHKHSQVVNTAWAVMTLLAANHPNKSAIQKGIDFILKMQEANGDFPQQAISGVFNHSCMITYTSYRNVFPIWALSKYLRHN